MRRSIAVAVIILLVSVVSERILGLGQSTGSQPAPKMPVNVRVLKGLTLKEVRAEMEIVAASLGVKCENCHVKGNFPADVKEDKVTARKMLELTKDINTRFADQFKEVEKSPSKLGKVTCFTCHNGAKEPENVPPDIAAAQ